MSDTTTNDHPTATVVVRAIGNGVSSITLSRPERLNALDYSMVSDLHDALDEIAADDSCKVVILTGAGRGFCAGLDLKDFGRVPAVGQHRHRHAGISGQAYLSNLALHIHDTPQVVLAAINGPAYGGGLALAAACDIRIAAETATMASAFIRTGLTGTDVGITYFLPRLIGAARAFDLILTGRTIDAAEADRMGFVSRVTTAEELLPTAQTMAEQMAAFTAFGLRRTKEVMWHNLEASSAAAAIALENRNQELGAREPEVIEFMQRYSEQRVGKSRS